MTLRRREVQRQQDLWISTSEIAQPARLLEVPDTYFISDSVNCCMRQTLIGLLKTPWQNSMPVTEGRASLREFTSGCSSLATSK